MNRTHVMYYMNQYLKLISLSAVALLIVLTGCATNWYAKSYQDYRPPSELVKSLPEGANPLIIHVEYDRGAREEAAKDLLRKNFIVIGESAFYAADATDEQLKNHARNIGAEAVLHSSKFSETKSGVVGVPQYNPGQSYRSSFSGYSGGRHFYGSGTTTTPGSFSTQYVPYSVDLHEYSVLYFAKSETKRRFGFNFRDLNPKEKLSLESNVGVAIDVVLNGSPAYEANLLEGDIITAIAGRKVTDAQSMKKLLDEAPAGSVAFQIVRKGAAKVVEVQTE